MPLFVRVRDLSTGHEFDVIEADRRIGKSMKLLNSKRYPPTRHPRPPKHRLNLNPGRRGATDPRPVEDGPETDPERE